MLETGPPTLEGEAVMTHRRSFWLALVATVGLLAASCTGTGESSGTSGSTGAPLDRDPNTLVVAVDAFNADFDPASAYLLSEALIWRGIYESLIRLKGDSASEVEPLLADSWEANADSSSWTFHLHPGITFSDGTPLDAEAVKANYVRTITIELGTQFILGSFLPKPEKQIVVEDPETIRFDLAYPYPHFDIVMAAQYGTGLVSPKVFEEHSTGDTDQGHEYLLSHAVGTGPYVLDTLEPGNQVILKRNEDYWRGWDGPHFDTIIIRSIPEGSTRRQLIEAGDVDTAIESTAEDTAAIRANPGLSAGGFKNLELDYIILGDYGPLADARARQAMSYLFPYDDFVNTVMKGTVERAHGPFPDLLFTHDPNVFLYDTDLEKARDLFAEAGVAEGTTFTYEYYTGFGKEVGLVLQQQLEQVGMHLKIIEKEFSALNADLTTDRPVSERANMYYWGWWPDYNDPSDYSWIIFNSDAAPDVCPCYNSGYYHDDRVDEIIYDGFSQTDDTKLTNEMYEAQDIMTSQDPPIIPVVQNQDNTYFRKDIKGMIFNPLYIQTWDFYALYRG
jgi:peptide/nickel transport system substrate-binding protein